jgi:nucleotide-binding universal stress UspA family protein
MVQIERILCAVDLLKPTQAALSHALRFAGAFKAAQLDLVNVSLARSAAQNEFASGTRRVEKLMLEHNGREKLDRLLAGAAPDILARATPYLLTGKVIPAVLAHARACNADLIVLGVGKSWAFTRLVLGMAERIVRATSCPVLSVREAAAAPVRIDRILLPVDFSSCTGIALDWASALAQRFGARLGLLHVSNGSGSAQSGNEQSRHTQLLDLAQRARLRGTDLDQVTRADGSTSARILEIAVSGGYDLIVMGLHPTRRQARVLGGVGSAVRLRSSIPVLSVRVSDGRLPLIADDLSYESPRESEMPAIQASGEASGSRGASARSGTGLEVPTA